MDQCDEILRPLLNSSLLSVIYPEPGIASHLNETAYTQPALFALEYALAEVWRSWGIKPDAVMGHSAGEYVAACVAGIFSLEDGLKLIAKRGRLMQALPTGGAMVAVFADESRVANMLSAHGTRISIAAINGPENTVISGPESHVEEVITKCEEMGISSQRLIVSHAFHSELVEPMLDEFEEAAAQIHPNHFWNEVCHLALRNSQAY